MQLFFWRGSQLCDVSKIIFYRSACAAFFKRCQTSGKRFPCRQGNGRCAFRKGMRSFVFNCYCILFPSDQKFKCRSCRYDKCVEFGMVVEQEMTELCKSFVYPSDVTDRPSVIRKTEESKIDQESILDKVRTHYEFVLSVLFFNRTLHFQCSLYHPNAKRAWVLVKSWSSTYWTSYWSMLFWPFQILCS